MEDCVFCKILKGDLPAKIFYQDDDFIIISNIKPNAKYHYLAIPKVHYAYLKDANDLQGEILGKMLLKIPTLTDVLHLENGYRLIINQGNDAGQEVQHLHIHILSGQKMQWTPV